MFKSISSIIRKYPIYNIADSAYILLQAFDSMAGEKGAAPLSAVFLLLYVTIAVFLRCSLDYFFTISYDLGMHYIVSTHLSRIT